MLKNITLKTGLCVIGGGMSGLCTAIAAARHGTKVVLIHERPVLGGNASSEIRMWICGAQGRDNRETGIIEEIMLENLYRNPTKNFFIWDSILLDFVRREQNITLLLNTACIDAGIEQGRFAHGRDTTILSVKAYQLTTQRFYTVFADNFADCSGDSILAPLTGAKFMYGRESAQEFGEQTHLCEHDRNVMGTSCLIQGRETAAPVPFIPSEQTPPLSDEDVRRRPMDLYRSSENFWYLELGGNENTVDHAEATRDELVPLALGAWQYLKEHPAYRAENWELDFLGFLPAKRESRRMTGEYIVTQRDISSDTVFDDTVAFGGWPLDDHDPGGYRFKGRPNTSIPTPAPYCLPYRALYSANVVNLFFAGRNISATHLALSSTRVMATCALLGQAVGTAASIACAEGLTPHEVYLDRLTGLQRLLMDDDCFLPHFRRSIAPECVPEPELAALCDGKDRPNRIYGDGPCGIDAVNGTELAYSLPRPVENISVHIVFDSDLNRDTLPGDACERTHATRANTRLDSPVMHMPATLCKEFKLLAQTGGSTREILHVDNNRRRSFHVRVDGTVERLALIPLSNWGGSESTRVFSFDFDRA
ncbi:MAG: FAD-dependent oxidoreductase [Clostridia bacterium]|nr:FAD-dependent oxidoreductase [Clostridia bacterium]